jgi:hypothetical protein
MKRRRVGGDEGEGEGLGEVSDDGLGGLTGDHGEGGERDSDDGAGPPSPGDFDARSGDGGGDGNVKSDVKSEGGLPGRRVVLNHMPGSAAFQLIEALNRAPSTDLPPFDDVGMNAVTEEIKLLSDAVSSLLHAVDEENMTTPKVSTAVIIHHASIERNKHCALAYLWQRLFRVRQVTRIFPLIQLVS